MSYVTNVILTTSVLDKVDAFLSASEIYFKTTDNPWERLFSVNREMDSIFPSRVLERYVYVGAFNYFDLSSFMQWLLTYPWEERECVQVFIAEQEDELFSIFRLGSHGYMKVIESRKADNG
jgi:hypothetical protein